MPLKVYPNAPYFDDYEVNGSEEKNYLRILFRPGRSVQVRELNALQTTLQKQIENFGSSVYAAGTPVIDGVTSYDDKIESVEVDLSALTAAQLEYVPLIKNIFSSGVKGDILSHLQISGNTYRFYIRYSSSDGEKIRFANDDDISISNSIIVDNDTKIAPGVIGEVTSNGFAGGIFVQSGVFFINGSFVYGEAQSIFIDKENEGDVIDGYAAFDVNEYTVDSDVDQTLLDNANGQLNFTAPGADRHAVDLILSFVENGVTPPQNVQRVKLLTIDSSIVVKPARTEYSNLDRVLAQRTNEESGSYTLSRFGADVREYFNDGSNRGKFKLDETDLSESDARDRLVFGLEPAIAYINGYRVAPKGKQEKEILKGRTTEIARNVTITAAQGNYVECSRDSVTSFYYDGISPITNPAKKFDILDDSATPAVIGTCRIRAVERTGLSDVDRHFRVYLYDIVIDSPYSFSNMFAIDIEDGGSFTKISNEPLFVSASHLNQSIFSLPFRAVSSIVTSPNTQIRYAAKNVFRNQAISSNQIAINAPSGSKFFNDEETNYVLSDGLTSNVSISSDGSLVTLTVTGTSATEVDVSASVEYIEQQAKKKNIVSTFTTSSVTLSKGDIVDLPHYDIYRITDIRLDSSENLKDDFILDQGQRSSFYQDGSIQYVGNLPLDGDLTITYEYFSWSGSTNYFSVDSYSSINHEDIPLYNGVRLSDVLDFRPYIGSNAHVHVDPNSVAEVDLVYHLPRVDAIGINTFGSLTIVSGEPSLTPKRPAVPSDTLVLYYAMIPAFTYRTSDVEIEFVDNKRYTMRDIGRVDARVSNLEYYTSLSLLEKDTLSKQIIDATGTERYKNGIIVDSFNGHNVGDVNNPAYTCAIDREKHELRPQYESNNIRFVYDDSNDSNIDKNSVISLSHDNVPLITQEFASESISVNPYDIATWGGSVELSPSSDEWKSTTRAPDVIINNNGTNDALIAALNESNVFATEWGEWDTNWTSTDTNQIIRSGETNILDTTTTEGQSRVGFERSLSFGDNSTESIGDNIIDISFVPFIRSRKIFFKCESLKPNTKMYAFFDNEDVTEYTSAEAYSMFADSTDVETFEGRDASDVLPIRNELVTNSSGIIEGSFIIPNNDESRFRVGQREFRITDSPTNDKERETTFASTQYSARGIIETRQENILSTRVPIVDTRRVEATREVSETARTFFDPLAQSFIIGNIPSGVFVTEVDLFFEAKDEGIPVTMQLVTVENGQPTQNVIPFSRVTKYPNEVTTSPDASVASTFAFDAPVYLEAGVEYAIVLLSNSVEWRSWVSNVGDNDVTTQEKIGKNPYAGVFFKSSNASTWVSQQNKDLKFTLKRAEFESNGTTQFSGIIPAGTEFDYSLFNVFISAFKPSNTSLTLSLQVNSSDPVLLTENTTRNLNSLVSIGEDDEMTLIANLSSTDSKLSPIIDLDRLSALFIDNVINNSVLNEDTLDQGESVARYITKRTVLNNPADQLNLFLATNRPRQGSNIHVWGKFGIGDTSFDSIDWTVLTPTNGSVEVNSDPSKFDETQYEYVGEEFTSFALKIAFTSNDKSVVPTLKDLRAIATL